MSLKHPGSHGSKNYDLWKRQMNSVRPPGGFKFRPQAGLGESEGVPIAHTTELSSSIEHVEPRVKMEKDALLFQGSELVMEISIPPAISGVPSTVPRGGIMGMCPLNPLYCDGMRVAKTMTQYDQFRIRQITFEYVPFTNALQTGGLAMVVVNDIDDPLPTEGGFPALRDALSRDGALAFNVYTPAACSQGTPLLKWYYTANTADADLDQPGQFYVLAGTDVANSGGASIPLGLVWMHYELECRAPSIERPIAQTFAQSTLSMNLLTFNVGAGGFCHVPYGTGILPLVFNVLGTVGWAIIVGVDDSGPGSSNWREWIDPATGRQHIMGPGNVLFWRCFRNGATDTLAFCPTLSAALGSDWAGNAYQATVATGATAKSFKLMQLSGSPITGSD